MEFLEMINFLATECDENILPIVRLIKSVFTIIQWLIPIALILMGSIDLGKAVLSSDDKEIKQATGKLVKRAIAAVAIFFIVFIVKLVMGLVADSDGDKSDKDNKNDESSSWLNCWDEA